MASKAQTPQYNDLMLLQKNYMVEGLPIIKDDHIECVACALGNNREMNFLTMKRRGRINSLN